MPKEKLFEVHEREFAELVPGGEQTLASGAVLEKRDVQTTRSVGSLWWQFLYELKSTSRKSYSLKLDDWKQLVDDTYSRSSSMRPVWAIRFYNPESKARADQTQVEADLVVLDVNDYVELISELLELRERVGSQEASSDQEVE